MTQIKWKRVLARIMVLTMCLSFFPEALATGMGTNPEAGTHEEHVYVDGACAVCGAVCPHEQYADGACAVCHLTHTEHTYEGGFCTVCQLAKPAPVVPAAPAVPVTPVEQRVSLRFACTPADAEVKVYSLEGEAFKVVEPEEDGSWLLLPGSCFYDATCEGYTALEKVELRVEAPEDGSLAQTETVKLYCVEHVYGEDDVCAVCGAAKPAAPADEQKVTLRFACTPEMAAVTVYTLADGEYTVVEPEEDGSWSLLPGNYFYDVSCEGFVALEKVELTVAAADGSFEQEEEVKLCCVEHDYDEDDVCTVCGAVRSGLLRGPLRSGETVPITVEVGGQAVTVNVPAVMTDVPLTDVADFTKLCSTHRDNSQSHNTYELTHPLTDPAGYTVTKEIPYFMDNHYVGFSAAWTIKQDVQLEANKWYTYYIGQAFRDFHIAIMDSSGNTIRGVLQYTNQDGMMRIAYVDETFLPVASNRSSTVSYFTSANFSEINTDHAVDILNAWFLRLPPPAVYYAPGFEQTNKYATNNDHGTGFTGDHENRRQLFEMHTAITGMDVECVIVDVPGEWITPDLTTLNVTYQNAQNNYIQLRASDGQITVEQVGRGFKLTIPHLNTDTYYASRWLRISYWAKVDRKAFIQNNLTDDRLSNYYTATLTEHEVNPLSGSATPLSATVTSNKAYANIDPEAGLTKSGEYDATENAVTWTIELNTQDKEMYHLDLGGAVIEDPAPNGVAGQAYKPGGVQFLKKVGDVWENDPAIAAEIDAYIQANGNLRYQMPSDAGTALYKIIFKTTPTAHIGKLRNEATMTVTVDGVALQTGDTAEVDYIWGSIYEGLIEKSAVTPETRDATEIVWRIKVGKLDAVPGFKLWEPLVYDTIPAGLTYVSGSAHLVDPTPAGYTTLNVTQNGNVVEFGLDSIEPEDDVYFEYTTTINDPAGSFDKLFINTAVLRARLDVGDTPGEYVDIQDTTADFRLGRMFRILKVADEQCGATSSGWYSHNVGVVDSGIPRWNSTNSTLTLQVENHKTGWRILFNQPLEAGQKIVEMVSPYERLYEIRVRTQEGFDPGSQRTGTVDYTRYFTRTDVPLDNGYTKVILEPKDLAAFNEFNALFDGTYWPSLELATDRLGVVYPQDLEGGYLSAQNLPQASMTYTVYRKLPNTAYLEDENGQPIQGTETSDLNTSSGYRNAKYSLVYKTNNYSSTNGDAYIQYGITINGCCMTIGDGLTFPFHDDLITEGELFLPNSVRIQEYDVSGDTLQRVRDDVSPSELRFTYVQNLDGSTTIDMACANGKCYFLTYMTMVIGEPNTRGYNYAYVGDQKAEIMNRYGLVNASAYAYSNDQNIMIRKYDTDTYEGLNGVDFTLKPVATWGYIDGEDRYGFTPTDGTAVTLTTAASATYGDGIATLEHVPLYTVYEIRETGRPAGYVADNTKRYVIFTTKTEANYTPKKMTVDGKEVPLLVYTVNLAIVSIPNTPVAQRTLTLSKSVLDPINNAPTTEAFPFTITLKDGYPEDYKIYAYDVMKEGAVVRSGSLDLSNPSSPSASLSLANGESVVLTFQTTDTLSITETSLPQGYMAANVITFYPSLAQIRNEEASTGDVDLADGNCVVEYINTYSFFEKKVKLIKVDSEDDTILLPNVGFSLYKASDVENGQPKTGASPLKTGETNSDGEILFEDLGGGDYALIETTSSDRYEPLDAPILFSLRYTGITCSDPDVTVSDSVTGADYSLTVPNTRYAPVDLTVSKTVTGPNGYTPDSTKAFTFTLVMTSNYADDLGIYKYTVTGDAAKKDMDLSSGSATFSLKHGEELVLENIPATAVLTVTETAETGYSASNEVTVGSGSPSVNQSATSGSLSMSHGDVCVDFTNTRLVNTVQILKTDENDNGLANAVFSLYGEDYGTSPSGATALQQNLTTTADGKINLTDLDYGTYYLVETDAPTGYMPLSAPVSFTLSASGLSCDGYTVTSTGLDEGVQYRITVPNLKFTKLTVGKTVTGQFGDRRQSFTFTLTIASMAGKTLSFKNAAGTTSTVTLGTSGEYAFTLVHGQSVEFSGIENGAAYSVVETQATGYTTKHKIGTGAETAGLTASGTINADTTVQFTNNREMAVPTGVGHDPRAALVYVLTLTMLGLSIARLIGKKKRRT